MEAKYANDLCPISITFSHPLYLVYALVGFSMTKRAHWFCRPVLVSISSHRSWPHATRGVLTHACPPPSINPWTKPIRFKRGKLKLLYCCMNESYHTRSQPDSVDGWLGFMMGDTLCAAWGPLFFFFESVYLHIQVSENNGSLHYIAIRIMCVFSSVVLGFMMGDVLCAAWGVTFFLLRIRISPHTGVGE